MIDGPLVAKVEMHVSVSGITSIKCKACGSVKLERMSVRKVGGEWKTRSDTYIMPSTLFLDSLLGNDIASGKENA
jgi:hypothetical protein